MTQLMNARVQERLIKLRMPHVATRLDALLSDAAKQEWTFLEFIDRMLAEETDAKQRKRITMGMQIAHFSSVKTMDTFDFAFQPTVDAKLMRELATGHFVGSNENVLMLGPPGVGKTHLAIALGRSVIEAGHSVHFTTASGLIGALAKAESCGQFTEKLAPSVHLSGVRRNGQRMVR